MTQSLCASCCYPLITKPEEVCRIFYLKYGRALILEGVEHELLDLLDLKQFAGLRSYDYNKSLYREIRDAESTITEVKVGYSTVKLRNLYEEIFYEESRTHPDSKWVDAVKNIIRELR